MGRSERVTLRLYRRMKLIQRENWSWGSGEKNLVLGVWLFFSADIYRILESDKLAMKNNYLNYSPHIERANIYRIYTNTITNPISAFTQLPMLVLETRAPRNTSMLQLNMWIHLYFSSLSAIMKDGKWNITLLFNQAKLTSNNKNHLSKLAA